MNEEMNDYIARLRSDAIKMFPGATSVKIFINFDDGVVITTSYNGQLGEFKSMKTIDGKSCTKRSVKS